MILDIIRKSGGTAVAVSDDEIMMAVKELASTEGIFAAPEGGAALAAYRMLLQRGFLKESATRWFCSIPVRATSISTRLPAIGELRRSRTAQSACVEEYRRHHRAVLS